MGVATAPSIAPGDDVVGPAPIMQQEGSGAWMSFDITKWLKRRGQRVIPKAQLTPDQRQELQETFAILDQDGSGSITLEEVGQALQLLDMPPERIKANLDALRAFDVNGDESVQMDEFEYMFGQVGKDGFGDTDSALAGEMNMLDIARAVKRRTMLQDVMSGGESRHRILLNASQMLEKIEFVKNALTLNSKPAPPPGQQLKRHSSSGSLPTTSKRSSMHDSQDTEQLQPTPSQRSVMSHQPSTLHDMWKGSFILPSTSLIDPLSQFRDLLAVESSGSVSDDDRPISPMPYHYIMKKKVLGIEYATNEAAPSMSRTLALLSKSAGSFMAPAMGVNRLGSGWDAGEVNAGAAAGGAAGDEGPLHSKPYKDQDGAGELDILAALENLKYDVMKTLKLESHFHHAPLAEESSTGLKVDPVLRHFYWKRGHKPLKPIEKPRPKWNQRQPDKSKAKRARTGSRPQSDPNSPRTPRPLQHEVQPRPTAATSMVTLPSLHAPSTTLSTNDSINLPGTVPSDSQTSAALGSHTSSGLVIPPITRNATLSKESSAHSLTSTYSINHSKSFKSALHPESDKGARKNVTFNHLSKAGSLNKTAPVPGIAIAIPVLQVVNNTVRVPEFKSAPSIGTTAFMQGGALLRAWHQEKIQELQEEEEQENEDDWKVQFLAAYTSAPANAEARALVKGHTFRGHQLSFSVQFLPPELTLVEEQEKCDGDTSAYHVQYQLHHPHNHRHVAHSTSGRMSPVPLGTSLSPPLSRQDSKSLDRQASGCEDPSQWRQGANPWHSASRRRSTTSPPRTDAPRQQSLIGCPVSPGAGSCKSGGVRSPLKIPVPGPLNISVKSPKSPLKSPLKSPGKTLSPEIHGYASAFRNEVGEVQLMRLDHPGDMPAVVLPEIATLAKATSRKRGSIEFVAPASRPLRLPITFQGKMVDRGGSSFNGR